MHVRDWSILLVESNKLDVQIIADVLRNAGVVKFRAVADSDEALNTLGFYPANVIIAALEMSPTDGVSWTRALRRNRQVLNRQAAIFLTSRAFSRAIAEECRIAGANALIGKPVSGATIIATIKKVLENPRPFIDNEHYAGPCRRAGIVTAGAGSRRRKSDGPEAGSGSPLMEAAAALAAHVDLALKGESRLDDCAKALAAVQALAVRAGDGPLMRACAAFTLILSQDGGLTSAKRTALAACASGVMQLAAVDPSSIEKRDVLAEEVRRAVARASVHQAA